MFVVCLLALDFVVEVFLMDKFRENILVIKFACYKKYLMFFVCLFVCFVGFFKMSSDLQKVERL